MTVAVSNSTPSQEVDVALTERAVKALLQHHKASTKEEKTPLLGNDVAIQVQFTLDKVPENPSQKPIRVLIPHALYKIDESDSNSSLEEPSVCLIVKDESKPWVQDMISQFPKEMGFVKKVLTLSSLRKKHGRYEQRRQLLSMYDVFMADDRILPMLAKSLGKEFFKAKKQPIPLALTRKQALPFAVLQSLQATFLFISSGTTLTVRAATTAMSSKQVLENVQAVVKNAVPKIPKRWSNIRCIAVKTPTSMSLPFYNKTPQELSLLTKMAGLQEATTPQEEMEADTKAKKEKKKQLKAKSPLVQALKKQKTIESSETKKTEETRETKKMEKKKSKKKRSLSTEIEASETVVVVEKKPKKKKRKEEIDVTETVAVESTTKKTFVASKKFKGSKKGYVFRAGTKGVGYYEDVKPVVDKMAIEALKRSAQQSSRGGGRKKKGKRGRR